MGRYTAREKLAAVAEYRRTGRLRETARRLGISYESIRSWDAALRGGALWDNAGSRRPRTEEGAMGGDGDRRGLADALPDDPDELKRIILEQRFELDLSRAVVEVLKKDPRVDPSALTNREKAAAIDAMRPAWPLGYLASRLGIALSTYHYNRAAARRPDKYGGLREKVRRICAQNRMTWGYRRVTAELRTLEDGPERRSEKVVLAVMREEGLLARRPRRAAYSSYSAAADASDLPNAPLGEDGTHDFSAPAPNALWLTDVTEMRIPAGRVYLSAVLDCFDGAVAGWKAATSAASGSLTDPSLEAACARLRPGERPTLHSDCGAQYHAGSWAAICAAHGIARSMSRKGHSPDNARMEGFFGLLKREFLYPRDWSGASLAEFMAELDAWLRWYNEGRRTLRLGWMSPMEYRRSLGLAA